MSPDAQRSDPCSSRYLEQKIEHEEEEEDLFLRKDEMERFRQITKGEIRSQEEIQLIELVSSAVDIIFRIGSLS